MTYKQGEADLFINLVTHINRSDLKPAHKNVYKMLLFEASPQVLALLLELFEKNPDWVPAVYNNYLKKRNILRHENPEAWNKFFQQEYSELKRMEI